MDSRSKSLNYVTKMPKIMGELERHEKKNEYYGIESKEKLVITFLNDDQKRSFANDLSPLFGGKKDL